MIQRYWPPGKAWEKEYRREARAAGLLTDGKERGNARREYARAECGARPRIHTGRWDRYMRFLRTGKAEPRRRGRVEEELL